jgi:hypothetical protein
MHCQLVGYILGTVAVIRCWYCYGMFSQLDREIDKLGGWCMLGEDNGGFKLYADGE